MAYGGELAGLATALCWALTSILFTIASARFGAVVLNRIRLVLAVLFLGITQLIVLGSLIPPGATPAAWLWLGLSGILGLAVGDSLLFHAFTRIGPRNASLIMSTVPVFSALLAWIQLGEGLTTIEMLGIVAVSVGVVVVLLERTPSAAVRRDGLAVGILAAFGAALAQAISLVVAKAGMPEGLATLSATLIRMIAACASIWLLALFTGHVGKSLRALRDTRGMLPALGGSVVGPYLGVWLSLVSIRLAPVGVASSLMGMVPIFVIPLAAVFLRERASARAIIGTVTAVAGGALFFLK